MKREKIGFIIVTLALALTAAFFTTLTVCSQNKGRLPIEETAYREMEAEYRMQLRGILEKYELNDSGINMTHISGDGAGKEGNRSYTVRICNKYVAYMDAEAREAMEKEINEIAFPIENCDFFHEFITGKEL